VSTLQTRPKTWNADILIAGLLWTVALSVIGLFGWIVGDLFVRGIADLSVHFLTEPPQQGGRAGGISTILVGTIYLVGVALAVALPIGIGAAIVLAEGNKSETPFGRVVRRSLDILAGVPSIVFGLFGLAFFGQFLGWGWSIASGGMTLACMILPLLVRSTEESLRAVPLSLRQGAAALGLSQGAVLWHLTLPAATQGIVAGVVLSIGRALAETAALLFTAGAAIRMPESLFDSARSLSYHIYLLAIEVPGGAGRAYASAIVLVGLLVLINVLAIGFARQFQHKLVQF
jgi:phosphate transport system permease protein